VLEDIDFGDVEKKRYLVENKSVGLSPCFVRDIQKE
jgi:hypothetical protein